VVNFEKGIVNTSLRKNRPRTDQSPGTKHFSVWPLCIQVTSNSDDYSATRQQACLLRCGRTLRLLSQIINISFYALMYVSQIIYISIYMYICTQPQFIFTSPLVLPSLTCFPFYLFRPQWLCPHRNLCGDHSTLS
jgi:hypothetical protein